MGQRRHHRKIIHYAGPSGNCASNAEQKPFLRIHADGKKQNSLLGKCRWFQNNYGNRPRFGLSKRGFKIAARRNCGDGHCYARLGSDS